MLKIKDNVTAKQLKKFGFTRIGNHYYHKFYNGGDYISIRSRQILIGIEREPVEDILFDLIQSGLVEKVEVQDDRKE